MGVGRAANKKSRAFTLLAVSEFYTRPLSSRSEQVSGINTINHCYHFLHSGTKQGRQIPSLAVLQFAIKAPNQKNSFQNPTHQHFTVQAMPGAALGLPGPAPCHSSCSPFEIQGHTSHQLSESTSMEKCRSFDQIQGVRMHSRPHFAWCFVFRACMCKA